MAFTAKVGWKVTGLNNCTWDAYVYVIPNNSPYPTLNGNGDDTSNPFVDGHDATDDDVVFHGVPQHDPSGFWYVDATSQVEVYAAVTSYDGFWSYSSTIRAEWQFSTGAGVAPLT